MRNYNVYLTFYSLAGNHYTRSANLCTCSFQKQFMYAKARPQMSRNEDASSQGSALIDVEIEVQEQTDVLDVG
jgi:hypothetical protein